MKLMAKSKAGVNKIAKKLKRTPGATTVMAAKHAVKLSMARLATSVHTGRVVCLHIGLASVATKAFNI